jgi:hypothetical protein
MNNMGREIMAALKRFQTGSDGDGVTVGGNLVVSEAFAAANTATLGNVTSAAFAVGSASSPTIHAVGDTNTGIFFPAADTIAFAEGGAEAMRIDSSGNLFVGATTSPESNVRAYFSGVGAGSGDGVTRVGIAQGANTLSARNYLVSGVTGGQNPYFAIETRQNDDPFAVLERMRIDSAGNVGIGTSSPAALLDVRGTSGAALISGSFNTTASGADNDTNSIFIGCTANLTRGIQITAIKVNAANAHNLAFSTSADSAAPTERMRIDSAGNVGIGITSVSSSISGSARVLGICDPATTNISSLRLSSGSTFSSGQRVEVFASASSVGMYGETNVPMIFSTNATERARIDTSGNLLVGGTGLEAAERLNVRRGSIATSALTVNVVNSAAISTTKAASSLLRIASNDTGADSSIQFTDSVANNYYFGGNNGGAYVMANTNGVRLSNGGTSWASDSDERLKDIIEPIINAAEKVSSLRAVIGKYKTDKEGVRRTFLIAQDVQAVLPEAVFDEQGTLMLAYTETIPLLVAAIKELKAELDTVKAELATLKAN